MSITIDNFGGIVEALGRDYFMEDYDNVEDLIKEIEEHCSLSRKEKERLRNLECFKEREDIDLG